MSTALHLSYRLALTPGPLDLAYTVDGEAVALGLTYQVDDTVFRSLRARPRAAGLRLLLNGHDVTRRLTGPISWTRRRDSPIRQGGFDLAGTEFLPHLSRETWTLTPLEVWGYIGPPAQEVERLLLSGYVITGDSEPVARLTTVSFADRGGIHHKADACYEAAPLAGLTQGQILKQIAYSAGIPEADAPVGTRITKPVTTQGKPAFSVLSSLADAAGWWLHFDDKTGEDKTGDDQTGGLKAEEFRLKRPPQAPDEIWHLRELYAPPQVSPPQPLPSRWLVRFTSAVEVDEAGIETETTKTTIESIYAPRAAVARQTGEMSDGGEPLTVPLEVGTEASFRVTKILCETTQRRADLVIRRVVEEYGWFNLERARLRVSPSPFGEFAEIYATHETYVDDSGVGRWWPKERFGLIRRVIETPVYDAAGTVLSQTRDLWEYGGTVAGLRHPGADTIHNVTNAGIGSDGESYDDFDQTPGTFNLAGRIFQFRLTERRTVTYHYGDTGHAARQVERVWRYFSPQASVDEAHGEHWITASGRGQVDMLAQWREVQTTSRITTTDAAGRVATQIDQVDAWLTFTRPQGRFDWGGSRSDAAESTWGTERVETKSYVVLSDQHYELVRDDGSRELHTGQPPLPQYLASTWTRLTQEAFEVVIDDPVLLESFGFSRRVVQNEWIETTAQAVDYLGRLFDAEYAHELIIARPLTQADVGSTIHVVDPERGIDHCMIVHQVETRIGPAEADGIYVLRQPLGSGVRALSAGQAQ